MRSNNEVTNGKPVTDEQFFHYFSGMKRMLLAIACLACGGAANAQLYRDSLYKAYKETFHSLRGHELEYNRVLFQTAERVFSVKHPAMVYAIKESRLEDSAAMAMLGREVVNKFLIGDFIGMACDHYEKEFEAINKFYTEDLCVIVTERMKVADKLSSEEMARLLEKVMMESSASMAKNKEFASRAQKVKEEFGIERILHTVECNTPYMYVNCPYMRHYIVNATVDHAVGVFVKWKRDEQMRMYASIKKYILEGENEPIKEFATEKEVSDELVKSLSAIRKRAKRLKPGRNELLYRPVVNGNKTTLSYVYVSPKPEILGGVDMNVQWKDFKWSIAGSSFIPEQDVRDRQALLNIASMQKMPVNKKVEEE